MEYKVIIVSFSSRNHGNCEAITDQIYEHFYKQTNVLVYKFSDLEIKPCGKCSYQCFADNRACPYIEDPEYALLDALCRSDMAYFIVPNYCDYPCANFFIFNERSQCYFQNHPQRLDRYLRVPKKFIAVSGSRTADFKEVFCQHTAEEPQILYLPAKAYEKQSIAGDILSSERAKADLFAFLEKKSL